MKWTQRGAKISCSTCGKKFAVGASCDCAPDETAEIAAVADCDDEIDPSVRHLMTGRGRERELASIFGKLEHAVDHIDIKRAEAQLKCLRGIHELQRERESTEQLLDLQRQLDELRTAVAGARGGAQREHVAAAPSGPRSPNSH